MTWTVVSEKFDAEMTAFQDLGEKKKIDNGADKKMDIDCGIGSINVAFMEQL